MAQKRKYPFFPTWKARIWICYWEKNVMKLSRLDRRLCELVKMENKNDVSKRWIILQPEDSQKVLPGRTVANCYESPSLQEHQLEWSSLSVAFTSLLCYWSLNLYFFWRYTYFLPFKTVMYYVTTSAILSHSVSWRPTQLLSYQSLFSEAMKESANLFRVWLHYHTSANVLTNPRRCEHSFSNCLKINEWQQNAKSKSKVTLSLIFSVCKAKLR